MSKYITEDRRREPRLAVRLPGLGLETERRARIGAGRLTLIAHRSDSLGNVICLSGSFLDYFR